MLRCFVRPLTITCMFIVAAHLFMGTLPNRPHQQQQGAISNLLLLLALPKQSDEAVQKLVEIFLNIRYYISTTALQIFAQIISCSTRLWPQIGQLDLSVSLSDSTSNLLISCWPVILHLDPETSPIQQQQFVESFAKIRTHSCGATTHVPKQNSAGNEFIMMI